MWDSCITVARRSGPHALPPLPGGVERFAHLANVATFLEQVDLFRELLVQAPPDEAQQRDIDFLQGVGQLFMLVAYAELVLENAPVHELPDDVVDELFDVFVRDFSGYAVELHGRAATTPAQAERCLALVRRPACDPERYERVWSDHVLPLAGAYEMSAAGSARVPA